MKTNEELFLATVRNATINTPRDTLDVLDTLIEMGVDINTRDQDGQTALILAVRIGKPALVSYLLKKGANVEIKDNDGDTALLLAGALGNTDMLNKLLGFHADINVRNAQGGTALMYAACHGHTEIIKRILAVSSSNLTGGQGYALVMLAHFCKMEAIETLLEAGANINAKCPQGFTALMVASIKGHTGMVIKLLDAHADLELKNQTGCTALSLAVLHGHIDIIQILLKAGANKHMLDGQGDTLLTIAASRGYLQVLKLLLTAGAPYQICGSGYALGMLASRGDVKGVKTLLDAGVSVDVVHPNGCTALMNAASSGHEDVVALLLSKGASTDAKAKDKDQIDCTALMFAASNGYGNVIKLLLEAGANKDAQDQKGHTALMYAAANGHSDALMELLYAGANKNLKSNSGITALKVAVNSRQTKTASILQNVDAFNDAIKLLNKDIDNFQAYGDILIKRGEHKGKVITQLVIELRAKVDVFKHQIRLSGDFHDPKVYNQFKEDFLKTLHSQDKVLGQHREYWALLANIVIALTGVGALFLVGQLVVSKVTTGQFSLFFKTESLSRADKIESRVNLMA